MTALPLNGVKENIFSLKLQWYQIDDDSVPFSTEVLIMDIHLKEISMEYLKVNIIMEELHSLLYETTY